MRYPLRYVALVLAIAVTTPLHGQTITTIASGLDNPRGLAFGPEGALYVAEAGRGGEGPCFDARGIHLCYGPSGAVTRIWKGTQERVATGLPSYANAADGREGTGPHDISFLGRGDAFLTIGLGMNPEERAVSGPLGSFGAGFGRLLKISASGTWQSVADVAAQESAANPDGGVVESNPYGVLAIPGGRLVTDAGGNALLSVSASGVVSTMAVFPSRLVPIPFPPFADVPMEAVPTSVAIGPDGAVYVGELTGFPFALGGANVYRIAPGQSPQVFASGFTNIIDIAWGADGSLYVLEIATHSLLSGDGVGALIRVSPDGTTKTTVTESLFWPGGLALGADGSFYISQCSVCAGAGEVVRVEP